jgi:putative transcriptional regulator
MSLLLYNMSGMFDMLPEPEVKNKLRVLRAERQWSQGELSQKLGVSRQAVNAIETEKHDPSLELAFRLSRLFGVSIEQIFEFENK